MCLDITNEELFVFDKELSKTMVALLNYAKQKHIDYGGYGLTFALKDIYPIDHNSNLTDLLNIFIKAYCELINEPRFEISTSKESVVDKIQKVILAPLKDSKYQIITHRQYTHMEFYDSIIKAMFNDFRLSRVDWCRNQLNLN